MKTNRSIDFAINGGGLVGALLALLLEDMGYHVLLIERNWVTDRVLQNQKDTRALGLNYKTLSLFSKWGLAASILKEGQPISHIHVSIENEPAIVHIDAAQEQLPYLGYTVPLNALLMDLQASVRTRSRITMLEGQLESIRETAEEVILTHQGQEYTARILIGADGPASLVREQMGVPLKTHDYGQAALIGQVTFSAPPSQTAFERFAKQGPVALLPDQEGKMTLVWVMPTSLAERHKNMPMALRCEDLQAIFGYRLGKVQALGPCLTYPLKQSIAERIHQGRMGLIGNAAHLLHPVAAQGFNLSVRDILCFVETVQLHASKGLGPALWAEYARKSAGIQKKMIRLTHAFAVFFEENSLPARALQRLFFNCIERHPFLKTTLNDHMVGRG